MGESSTSTASKRAFDGIAREPPSSSSTLKEKGRWDVFINHRNCDTKRTLASTIYHTLDLIGLGAFLDVEDQEIPIPPKTLDAINTAGLHIAIFSKNYAQSPRCLDELSQMLKTGTPIVPVFYRVQPDELRWVAQEKGCYAPVFSQYKENGRYLDKLEEWKTALETVSIISGHVLNIDNGDEGVLLKRIVNSVLRVIKKGPLEVAKHLVGMDEIVDDFERRRQEYSESKKQVEIIGIVGVDGSGKTALATELYNRKGTDFNRSSFVYDVRDAASKNALHTKQKKLLEDLRIQTTSFDNFKEGKRIVEDRLKTLKILRVLIVLDDVDDGDQLDALLPKESLSSDSLVIVTTRVKNVLTKWGITSIFKMQPLQPIHAKQLFCWHAFLQDSPEKDFEDLVENFLNVCKGLPLSLKVIGGQLYGKSTQDWISQLEKIRGILHKEIMQRPKVGYD